MNRILILSPKPSLPGGVSNYIRLLSQYLDKQEFEISYVYTGKSNSGLCNIFYPFLLIYQFFEIKKKIKIFNPDLIHMNPSLNSVAIFRDFIFLKEIKKRGIPVLFFIHGWQKKISKKFDSKLFSNYYKIRFEMADAIVVLAEKFKEELIHLGVDSKKLFVSSTMVESAKYLPENKFFSNSYRVLFCATMVKEKGPFEILEAAPIVLTKFPETKFTFVGNGKDLEKLKKRTKKIGIKNNVEFTGYVSLEEKIKIFKKSQVFVFPSSHGEGFPTVILEAMAAGLPIITTPNAGIFDAIKDGRDGFLLRNNSRYPKEIAEKLINMFENSKLLEKMSENNLKRAKEEYDVKIITDRIKKIYREIV